MSKVLLDVLQPGLSPLDPAVGSRNIARFAIDRVGVYRQLVRNTPVPRAA